MSEPAGEVGREERDGGDRDGQGRGHRGSGPLARFLKGRRSGDAAASGGSPQELNMFAVDRWPDGQTPDAEREAKPVQSPIQDPRRQAGRPTQTSRAGGRLARIPGMVRHTIPRGREGQGATRRNPRAQMSERRSRTMKNCRRWATASSVAFALCRVFGPSRPPRRPSTPAIFAASDWKGPRRWDRPPRPGRLHDQGLGAEESNLEGDGRWVRRDLSAEASAKAPRYVGRSPARPVDRPALARKIPRGRPPSPDPTSPSRPRGGSPQDAKSVMRGGSVAALIAAEFRSELRPRSRRPRSLRGRLEADAPVNRRSTADPLC